MIQRSRSWSVAILVAFLAIGTFACRTRSTDAPVSELRAGSADASSLRGRQERPTTNELDSFSPASLDRITGPIGDPTGEEAALVRLYEELTVELLQNFPNHKILVFARDGEWLYDSMTAVLSQTTQGKQILERIKLVNISRPIAERHTPQQLRNFLQANGMDLEAVMDGREKVLWFDTGNRGRIFLNLFKAIFDGIPTDGRRASKISNVLSNIDCRLISSQGTDAKAEMQTFVRNYPTASNAQLMSQMTSYYFFGEVLADKRRMLGIPEDRTQRWRWVVDKIEHTTHWTGRALTLDPYGKRVTSFENDPTADMSGSLRFQRLLKRYFEKPTVVQKVQQFLDSTFGASAATPVVEPPEVKVDPPSVAPSRPKVSSATEVSEFTGETFSPGEHIQTEQEREYIIGELISDKKEFTVYSATEVASGKNVTIKFPKSNDPKLLKEIQDSIGLDARYKRLGISAATLVEGGSDYIIKENIEGITGEEWLRSWESRGYPVSDPGVKRLNEILLTSANKEYYIGELLPSNMIWTGSDWVLLKSGSIDSLPSDEILERYSEKFARRWGKLLEARNARAACDALLKDLRSAL